MMQLRALVSLLLTESLPDDLRTLHNLALYESGGALLGEEEKNSLLNAMQLAERIEDLPETAKNRLRSLTI